MGNDMDIWGLTLSGGNASFGGAISSYGCLCVCDCVITGNYASAYGAGIYMGGGMLNVSNSIISNNSSIYGGGIYSQLGIVTIDHSTISNNSAFNGGGIYSYTCTSLSIDSSTISGNTTDPTSGRGGGVYTSHGPVSITNSSFANNIAVWGGGF